MNRASSPLVAALAGLLLALLLCTSVSAQTAACIAGTWTNDDASARILVYPTKSGKWAGKIIWLKEPNHEGKPKTDFRNSNEALRSRPIIGLVILKGFSADDDDTFDGGTIYDPKNGKTYDSKMTCLEGGKKLSIRGYIGISMIGRSTTWTRVQ